MATTKHHVLAQIQRKFGYYKLNLPQVQVNCPFCEARGLSRNTTYKLGIHLDKEVYHCFRCDAKGKLSTLFPNLISTPPVKPVESTVEGLEPLPEMVDLKDLKYPWTDIVYGFLNEKGFPAATLAHKVFFVDSYKKKEYSFGPRLIFPIYQSGKYRGFQARTVYKNTDPKYIGASGMDRKSILYNYDTAFKQGEQLVLTEGFFDQIRVGDSAVATLGKIITDEQIRLIKLGSFKRVVVFLDDDAKDEAKENANKLKKYFTTYIATPTKHDPGGMTRIEIQQLFNNKLDRVY